MKTKTIIIGALGLVLIGGVAWIAKQVCEIMDEEEDLDYEGITFKCEDDD